MDKLSVNTSAKDIIKLALPISIALLIPQINIFANNIFMDRLGERELGVNGITGVFYLILSMIGYGLSSGIQIQMARRAGEENRKGITETLMNGLMLSLMFSLFLMLITLWVVPLLFGYSLSDPENFALSVKFVFVRVWGLPFLMFTQIINAFFISIGKSRFLIYGSIAFTLTNVLLDYTLIFGQWGMPNLGFQGAAVSSTIAEIAYFITMVGCFVGNKMHKDYPVTRYITFDYDYSIQSLKVAAPLIVQFMFSIGGWLVFFFLIEHLGKSALAGSQILRGMFGIIGVGTWALATTCNTMVSNLMGQGKANHVMSIVKKISKLSLMYTVIVCAVIALFPHQFLGLYTDKVALIEYTVPSLRAILLSTLIMSVSTVAFNGVVGTGNTLINLSIEITCVALYLVYCYLVIYRWKADLSLCWMSEFVYWLSLIILSGFYLRSGRWKGKVI